MTRQRVTKTRAQVNASYSKSPRGRAVRWRLQDERNTRLRRLLEQLKDVPCADCGGRYPTVCMDFDHRPGTEKKFSISGAASRRPEDVRAEIAKCDIVCANCHRIRTAERNVQREYWQARRRGERGVEPVQLSLGARIE